MSAVLLFDLMALAGVLLALRALVSAGRPPHTVCWWGLFAVVFLVLFRNISNVFEWSGLTSALDPFEDHSELLLPVAWLFLVHALLRESDERRLRTSEARYRSMSENIDLGVNIIDESNRILMANTGSGKLFRKEPSELEGRYCHVEFKQSDEACTSCPGAIALRTGEPAGMRSECVRSDGTRFNAWIRAFPLFDDQRQPSGFVELIEDVTERDRLDLALREGEMRLRSIIQSAPTGIGLMADRVLLDMNERLCQMVGYTEAELVGQDVRILYPREEDYESVGRDKAEQIRRHGTSTVETVWQRKDGELIHVILNSTPLDPDDRSKGVTFTALDITERKRAVEERLSLERQVQHAQKLESLGLLAGGIAHDFNNILMAVLGNADLALQGLPEDAPVRDNVRNIERAAKRAAGLAKQMLAYSGRGRFLTEAIDLNAYVRELAQLLEASISKKVRIEYDFDAALPLLEGDAAQLRQVVMNLITNASEAIGDESGTISLSTESAEYGRRELEAAHPAATASLDGGPEPGTYVRLEVADDGVGMSEETRSRLFEPFYTTKFTGRGLGMAAVLGIVRGHGGTIFIESEPGRGSRLRVLFPVTALSGEPEARAAAEAPVDGSLRGAVVLVADDEEVVRRVCRGMLEQLGVTVLTAADGREALEVYREHRDVLQCVLLDLAMPELSGEEVYEQLRAESPGLPVVLSSGLAEEEATRRFTDRGLAGFLQKPYGALALTTTLKRALQQGAG